MSRVYPNINWKNYLNNSNKNTIEYLKKYGNEFILQTFNKIQLAKRLKRKSIVLFRFRNSNIIAVVSKSEYQSVITELINLCVKLEFYETASLIQKSLKPNKSKISINKKVIKSVTLEH
jgi:hypothetical protein